MVTSAVSSKCHGYGDSTYVHFLKKMAVVVCVLFPRPLYCIIPVWQEWLVWVDLLFQQNQGPKKEIVLCHEYLGSHSRKLKKGS